MAGEILKKIVEIGLKCFIRSTPCVSREKIYIFSGKSSSGWPKIILQALDVDLSCYTTYGGLFFCKQTCYKHLTKVGQATFKVKEIKQETEVVICARDPVRSKWMIQSKYWEENKYVRKSLPVEGIDRMEK